MPMQVIFLRGGGFFFDSGVRVYWWEFPSLPKKNYIHSLTVWGRTEELDGFLKSILKGTAENTPRVKRILCLETVAQPDGRPASFICYRCTAGTIQTRTPSGPQPHISVGDNSELLRRI